MAFRPSKIKILGLNLMKMQNSILPKFEISFFEKLGFGKLRNRDTKTWNLISIWSFWDRNSKSIPKTKNLGFKKWEIGTSKSEIRFWFWIFGPGNWFWKFENHFLPFLSNFDLGPQNLKSATSKTPKSWFSLQNLYFRCKFFFDQNLDFVLIRLSSAW